MHLAMGADKRLCDSAPKRISTTRKNKPVFHKKMRRELRRGK